MLFNSIQFVIFFVVVTKVFFALPHRFRWLLLLLASCYFYMAFVPVYILILFFTIVIDYIAGILLEDSEGKRKKLYLIMSLIANIGVLAIFKYYNFLNENITQLLGVFSFSNPIPYLSILLPIGLSFHTFQAMSYTIEVYRGNHKAERNFGIYALYVMFYPQLVAGPIERPQNILHQFHQEQFFNYNRFVSGLRLMAWGFFKKIVVADRLAFIVDTVYKNPESHTGKTILIAIVCFSFQIYSDFSAYSDIAIGSARVMGYDLMKNFNNPFVSKNITEFWRRWHISLSTWFNDYLFTPFIVSKRDWGKLAVVAGLFMTFFFSGIWHGAGWTFIIYGIMHGLATIYEFLTKKSRKKLSKKMPRFIYDNISIFLTFSFVSISWIFFRSETVQKAFYMFTHLFSDFMKVNKDGFIFDDLSKRDMFLSFVFVSLMLFVEKNKELKDLPVLFNRLPIGIRWAVYAFFFLLILVFGVFENKQFIYFQF
jgi:D-alanyl-lipoteichoic acid acyltransferase DltB (MBOAT superfamily)